MFDGLNAEDVADIFFWSLVTLLLGVAMLGSALER